MKGEEFLAGILFGGGSGGPSLPAVTPSDNGKILRVIEGAWAKAENDFVVTFSKSGSAWSSNKTAVEIADAYSAGKNVYGICPGSAVTNDSSISNFNLILPLSGVTSGYYSTFGGSYQSDGATVFATILVGLNSSFQTIVTGYTKTVNIPEQMLVTFTITGQPVGGVYPMTADKTFSEIGAAVSGGRSVVGLLTVGTDTINIPLVSYGSGYFAFSSVTYYNTDWSVFQVEVSNDGTSDTVQGSIVPISTVQMQYNTTSDTLSITNVPEVS